MVQVKEPVKPFKPSKSLFSDIHYQREGDEAPLFLTYQPGSGWVKGQGGLLDVHTPIDETTIARVHLLGSEEAREGLRVLYEKGRWEARNTPGEKRLRILNRLARILEESIEDFVNALVLDAGKPLHGAEGEVKASIDRIEKAMLDLRKISGDYIPGDWDAHTLETEGLVRREPYGVVAAIVPFNYPLYDSVMKIVSAFIAGNAVLLKPSSSDPLPAVLLVRALLEAGFPPNAIMLAMMRGRDFGGILPDRRIGAVMLTGSTETGKQVLAKAGIKSYLLELGGGDPALVLRDADIRQAADNVVKGIISYSGQRCDAIKLILVEEPIYEEFKTALLEELGKQVRIGDPRDPSTTVGPLIDSATVDEMEQAVKDAVEKGGRIIYGGRRLGPTYIEPTVIEVPRDKIRNVELYSKEVFAPVALLTSVSSLDEAIELANGRPYGLDAAVFSKNLEWIRKAIRYLEVGAVYVNMFPRHGIGYYPYGGRKDSGIGMEGIGYSIEYVSAYKSIIFNYKGARIWDYMV